MQLSRFPLVTFERKTINVVQSLEFIDLFNYPLKIIVSMLKHVFSLLFFIDLNLILQ